MMDRMRYENVYVIYINMFNNLELFMGGSEEVFFVCLVGNAFLLIVIIYICNISIKSV